MGTTSDRNDPRLTRGVDTEPVDQAPVYLVASPEEIAKGYVRPYRTVYQHAACGGVTTMSDRIAATYARQPSFYGSTYCTACRKHLPVSEFNWVERDGSTGSLVGS